MHREKAVCSKSMNLAGKGQKGVALVMTLLLLLLLTGLSVVMVLSTNSDLMTNGYYRGFRGSFYASDSGLNVVRQATVNQMLGSVQAGWGVTKQPIPAGTEAAVQTTMTNAYGTGYGNDHGRRTNRGLVAGVVPAHVVHAERADVPGDRRGRYLCGSDRAGDRLQLHLSVHDDCGGPGARRGKIATV